MAYIKTEEVKAIREALKDELGLHFKFQVRRCPHDKGELQVNFLEGSVDFSQYLGETGKGSLNLYHLENYPRHRALFDRVLGIIKRAPATIEGGREWRDRSDDQQDVFRKTFEIELGFGSDTQPYVRRADKYQPMPGADAAPVQHADDWLAQRQDELRDFRKPDIQAFVDAMVEAGVTYEPYQDNENLGGWRYKGAHGISMLVWNAVMFREADLQGSMATPAMALHLEDGTVLTRSPMMSGTEARGWLPKFIAAADQMQLKRSGDPRREDEIVFPDKPGYRAMIEDDHQYGGVRYKLLHFGDDERWTSLGTSRFPTDMLELIENHEFDMAAPAARMH